MKKIGILCDSNPFSKPRPARMIEMLKDHYPLFVFGRGIEESERVLSFPLSKSSSQRSDEENNAILKACLEKNFDFLLHTKERQIFQDKLLSTPSLSLLIVEDITLLPFALSYKEKNPKCKVMIDLREFYPLEYENDPSWLRSFGAFFEYLCSHFLHKVDFALTVSEGIAKKYQEVYSLPCTLFLSLPPYYPLTPAQNTTIRLIYHGLISSDRESENLLEIARNLRSGIEMNLMVLSNHTQFLQDFKNEAQNIPNLSLLPPVRLEEIIPFTSQFDVGLITLKPNGFNNTNALPNKFFEYIQARLALLTTPLPSLAPMIERYKIGKCSSDFSTSSLIESINSLSLEEVQTYKQNSHIASEELNLTHNQAKILNIIQTLLGEK